MNSSDSNKLKESISACINEYGLDYLYNNREDFLHNVNYRGVALDECFRFLGDKAAMQEIFETIHDYAFENPDFHDAIMLDILNCCKYQNEKALKAHIQGIEHMFSSQTLQAVVFTPSSPTTSSKYNVKPIHIFGFLAIYLIVWAGLVLYLMH